MNRYAVDKRQPLKEQECQSIDAAQAGDEKPLAMWRGREFNIA
jgi:hypothetical protein